MDVKSMRATPRAFRVTVRRAMPETLGIRRLCAAPARLPCRSMSPSRQEVEIRVYHERRLGIGPWLEPVDPFLAYRPEVAVSPELAMGYLTRTPATRTAQHVCDQLIAAARHGRFDGLRFAGARALTPARVVVDSGAGAGVRPTMGGESTTTSGGVRPSRSPRGSHPNGCGRSGGARSS
jgi:hypothetical protein